MAFPQTPLAVTVELQLGGVWVDITDDTYLRDKITISWGRQDEGSRVDTAKCPLTLNNRDGKYSPKNPNSPYYGQLGRNTPLRIGVTTPTGRQSTRFEGHVSSWPTRWDLSGNDVYVGVQANGILRRLSQGVSAVRDPLRRHIEKNSPLAYWPLTDGEDARHGSEIAQGSQPMRAIGEVGSFYQGQPNWHKGALASWLDPVVQLPDDTTGRIRASVPPYNVTSWAVDYYTIGGGDGASPSLTVLDTGPGSDIEPSRSWELLPDNYFDDVVLYVLERGETTSSTANLGTINASGLGDGSMHMVRLSAVDNGAGAIEYAVVIDGVTRLSGTRAVQNRAVRLISYRWNLEDKATPDLTVTSEAMALGHLTYWGPGAPTAVETWRAAQGHVRELAGRRIERLCAEENVPLQVTGNLDHTPQMGPQRPGTFLDLLQSAADVDGGVVYESRAATGLAFRTQRSKYNQGS